MQLRIASKRTNGGSILLAAELSKRFDLAMVACPGWRCRFLLGCRST
jgi:hypothetical protein